MGKILLGYWNIRAFAEPIRYALEFAGAEYEEKLYSSGPDASTFDNSEWLAEKFELGLDFPNLPYIIDGDLKLTEAMACLKYVCRKYGAMPKSERDIARADNVEGVLLGLRQSFFMQFFTPTEAKFEESRKTFKETTFPDYMKKITAFIGNNKWLISNEITYVDFQFYTLLNYANLLNPGCLKPYSRLEKYVKDFEALEPIKKYQTSNRFREYPVTVQAARWGHKKE